MHDVNPLGPVDNGTAPPIIRDGKGRFVKGSGGGPGNPYARRVARLRRELYRAVTPEDLRTVVRALVEKARSGDVAAIKELLDRTIGKARPIEDADEAGDQRRVIIKVVHGDAPPLE